MTPEDTVATAESPPQPPASVGLPPMTALEFAIASVFRNFFFGLRMAIMWAILLVPFAVGAYFLAFRAGPPDFAQPSPSVIGAAAILGTSLLLASFSIAVNWNRRLVLDETPRRFGWVRLDGVVWRYLFGFFFILLVIAVIGGAASASALLLPAQIGQWSPALPFPINEGAARGIAYAIAAILGLFGFFTLFRLLSWLPAIAVGDTDYTVARAWRTTRRNRLAYLGFTFWLLFTLAIAGAIGAAAVFAHQTLQNPYVTWAAFGLVGLLGWLTLFLFMSVPASHYCYFSGRRTVPKE